MRHVWHCVKIAAGMLGKRRAYAGPLWVQIGIANPCNHRCIMCWDHPSFPRNGDSATPTRDHDLSHLVAPGPARKFMDLEMLERLAADLHALGTKRIELAGRGEPLLHPDFDRVVTLLKRRRFNVGIVTNGSLLTPQRSRHLVRSGVDRIVLSLNAGTRETYPSIHTTAGPEDYDAVIANLHELRRAKSRQRSARPRVMLSFVICRPNYREGMEMVERARDVGADELVFKYAIPYPQIGFIELTRREKREFSEALADCVARAESYGITLKVEPPIGDVDGDPRVYHEKTRIVYSRVPCYVGWFFTLITAEGLVTPCCQCAQPVGDLRQNHFREIWESDRYARFRERMKQLPIRRQAPSDCECDKCAFEKINVTAYNTLHFYHPARLHHAQREFSLIQLLPAVLGGRATGGAHVRHNRAPRR